MPNHVMNKVTFHNIKTKEEKDYILNMVAKYETDGWKFDFNKIIPEPITEDECPEDCKVNKDSHVMEDKDRPWFDWYAWRNKYWNTKWGAYECCTTISDNEIIFEFQTAWSFARPIAYKLHLLGFDFTWEFADEDFGSNCGITRYDQYIGYHYYNGAELGEDPTRFAMTLWGYDEEEIEDYFKEIEEDKEKWKGVE